MSRITLSILLASLVLVSALFGIASEARAGSAFFYDPITWSQDLGTLGGSDAIGCQLNDSGTVVGYYMMSSGQRAFIWDSDTGMQHLDIPTTSYSCAYDINNHGQVVGTVDDRAFVWDSVAGFRDIGLPAGRTNAIAHRINDNGQVLVQSFSNSGYWSSYLWEDGLGWTQLPTLGLLDNYARDLNSHGQVVGSSKVQEGEPGYPPTTHAYVWSKDSGIRDLGPEDEWMSEAYGINDSGMIVGRVGYPSTTAIWTEAGGWQSIGGPIPRDINNSGQVVGGSSVWDASTGWKPIDVGLSGTAFGINDAGQITGSADTFPSPQGFIQTHAGPWDYSDPNNWDRRQINGIMRQTLEEDQTVYITDDVTLESGLTAEFDGSHDLTLLGKDADHTAALNGDVCLSTVSGGRSLVLGSAAAGQRLNLTLNGARRFDVAGTDSLVIANAIGDGTSSSGFTKDGDGMMVLSSASTFSGEVIVAGGVLVVNANGALGGAAGGTVVRDGATLVLNAPLYSGNERISISGAGVSGRGAIDADVPFKTIEFCGPLHLAGPSLVNGPWGGTLVLSGVIDDRGAGYRLTVDNQATVVLAAQNTYSGTTELTNGILRADDGVGLPKQSLLLFSAPANGPRVSALCTSGLFDRSIGADPGDVFLAGKGGFTSDSSLSVRLNGGGAVRWGDSGFFAGIGGQLVLGINTQGVVTFENDLDLNGAVRMIMVQGKDTLAVITGNLGNSAQVAAGLRKMGKGTLRLSDVNTYDGRTVIEYGVVEVPRLGLLGSTGSLGCAEDADNGEIEIRDGTLRYVGGDTVTDRRLNLYCNGVNHVRLDSSGDGPIAFIGEVVRSPVLLRLMGTNSGRNVLSGSIADGRSTESTRVFKEGSGRWILGGDNTYTGTTSVSGGSLVINGTCTGGGAYTVTQGATLSGSGAVAGDISVSGGRLAPGDGLGAFGVDGNVAIWGVLEIEVDPELGVSDCLVVSGDLDIRGCALDLVYLGSLRGGTYVVARYGSLVGEGFDDGSVPAGVVVDYNYGGESAIAIVVPEPCSVAVVLAAGVVILRRPRRAGRESGGGPLGWRV